ncbi:MAG: tagatose-bisphosphate aldolase [Candidatus Vogelbacteria bacterium CG10_big_fil_rev_8_21_14_0_10_49_38]|uniref:Tagatose-bisphosphate aldolase n=1 Tax=Candidatus Vogelbacteria bacterium CG10_big_fil_rev_8_21_14_0_10_49_38 TaxID=1975043 RepID=A0A2H0RHP6_9BACT|nr:MAG: tagatose-bisphosphate aldolase [bacterium CG10_49_38]PIR46081.1 MAG: tagatose-bisphosphate aldolase [Candidatus Vogelbacteria bacterium CG10_big_fil_rev_8_21_14_0_10_49_38]
MKTLKETIKEAEANQTAIGHFNIANLEGLWAIFRAAQTLNLPVIIGLSEGERDFVGARQARVLVSSLREEFAYPIWLSADHTYSLDRAQEAIDLGYDLIVFDRSELPLAENISETKRCVEYARSVNPEILVEGELGHIGKSSKLLDLVPEGVALTGAGLTTEAEAKQLVEATGVDLFSPAVGNFHGMLKSGGHPQIDVELIKKLRQAAGVPLVLHGGSGITNDGFSAAIKAGISIVHINTELRVVYRDALRQALADEPDEIAPYKILKNAVTAMREVTERRLKLFAGQVN